MAPWFKTSNGMKSFLFALLVTPAMALPFGFWKTSGGGGPSYLVNQNFEGTGYDNGETWTSAGGGTVNADYATNPIVGSQSLYITGTATSTYRSFSAQDSVFGFARVRFETYDTGGNRNFWSIRDGSGTSVADFGITSAGKMRATAAGGSANTSLDTIPTGGGYDLYIWFEYVKGTGSDAIARVGWSMDGTKPTFAASAAKSAVSSNGTTTSQGARFYWGATASSVFEIVTDKTLISTTAIGNNP